MPSYLFIFSHDQQLNWYRVFAEGFRECGSDLQTVLFVHGKDDLNRARQIGCYDIVLNVLEGLEVDQNMTIGAIPVHPEIVRLEEITNTSFFWEDIRVDRWASAINSENYMVQYLNHAVNVVLNAYKTYKPIAALGEYTMALYRFAYRYFNCNGKPMFYPVSTRYFERINFETDVYWGWNRCIELYKNYLEYGVPSNIQSIVEPIYENIAIKYKKPHYSDYQNQFKTGFTRIRSLNIYTAVQKVVASMTAMKANSSQPNLRLALVEKGPAAKFARIVRERANLHRYSKLIAKTIPDKVKYCTYFLHYQPEYTSNSLGKFYTDQQFLIKNIASSLPANTYLIVKEHPTMVGLRSHSFYQDITRNPNTILIDHAADSIELIKNSCIVFTIVGTPALEAMFIGKPAVMFGRYAFANTNLISLCTDFWSLNEMIREKLNMSMDAPMIEKHALALMAAKYAASKPGRIPIAVELIDAFLNDRDNYRIVKQSFQAVLRETGTVQ
jgi:hypothetical protein